MRATAKQRELTELEGAALGVVARDGPCTPYRVKEIFRASPSEFWSGSAGSIYPLMQRLEKRGLVASERGATGRRGRKTYRATALGLREFRRWLTDAGRALGLGFDPLRTRLLFLDQLSRPARARFHAEVGRALGGSPLEPLDDPRLARLHRIWTEARRLAFERFVATLDDPE